MSHARRILRFISIVIGTSFLTFLLFALLTAFFYAAASAKAHLMVP